MLNLYIEYKNKFCEITQMSLRNELDTHKLREQKITQSRTTFPYLNH